MTSTPRRKLSTLRWPRVKRPERTRHSNSSTNFSPPSERPQDRGEARPDLANDAQRPTRALHEKEPEGCKIREIALASTHKKSNRDLPVKLFKKQEAWAAWLDKHGGSSTGLWLRLARKSAPIESLSYTEAVDVALCYGWIDGQKKGYDAESWLQKFTPRGPN